MYCSLSYIVNKTFKFYKDNVIGIQNMVTDTDKKFNRETKISINSHTGTHVDYPAHFVKSGKYGDEYPINYLCSNKVQIFYFNLLKQRKPRLDLERFSMFAIEGDTEILFINTYFYTIRNSRRYVWNSPVIDSDIPLYLKKNYPKIKAVGFDIISVTSQLDRDEGRACHYNFLSSDTGKEILIIEDVNYENLKNDSKVKEVVILPLMFKKMDGSPCAIMAKLIDCDGE